MNSKKELEGKVILVTGATSGIGYKIATLCVEYGAKVIFSGRSLEKLDKIRDIYGDNHLYIDADLTNDEDLEKLSELSLSVNGLIHCAGIMKTIPTKFVNRKSLDEIMNTNFYSSVILNSLLLKKKKILKAASIVFISSIGGNYIASKGNALYSASKGAVNAYAKVLALELANLSIRVNTLNPGMIKTELWNLNESSISAEQIAEDEKKYPLGYGETVDVAEASIFLLSNKSKWITGSNIVLDGGFTIQ